MGDFTLELGSLYVVVGPSMIKLEQNYRLLDHIMYNYTYQLSSNFLHSRLITLSC